MTESWAEGLGGLIGQNRSARERLAELSDEELDLDARILQCFAAGKPAPRAQLDRSATGLRRLVTRDLIQLDAAGDVAAAYPFSALPHVIASGSPADGAIARTAPSTRSASRTWCARRESSKPASPTASMR